MKMAEFWKMVLVSFIVDFDDIQLWLSQLCLNLNILQSYDSLPDFLRPKFEEYRHNFARIEIQAKQS